MSATKLYVGNLPYSINNDSLAEHFSAAGTVTQATVITQRDTGRSKGFGFVEFDSPEAAQKAIEMFHEQEMDGRKLIVNEARPKQPRNDRNFR